MSRTLILSTAVFCLIGCSDPNDNVAGTIEEGKAPRFLRDKQISCATFAEAVNYYLDMGEGETIAALRSLIAANPTDPTRGRARTRMALVCRVLFEPKGKEPLRAPLFGGLYLPWSTMPRERWPLYPVVRSGSSFFVLSEGYYMPGGKPERTEEYLDYCCTEGRFRKERVPVPTREQALLDLQSLRDSEAWKSLKWKDDGQGFEYDRSEQSILEYLKAQTDWIRGE